MWPGRGGGGGVEGRALYSARGARADGRRCKEQHAGAAAAGKRARTRELRKCDANNDNIARRRRRDHGGLVSGAGVGRKRRRKRKKRGKRRRGVNNFQERKREIEKEVQKAGEIIHSLL